MPPDEILPPDAAPLEEVDPFEQLLGEDADDFKARMRSEIRASDSIMFEQREKLKDHYAAYRMTRQDPEHNYEDDVRLPVIRSGVLSRVPKKMAALFLSTAPATVDPAPGVTPESAEAMEDLINQQWNDENALNGLEFAYKIIKMGELAGTAWAFVGWKEDKRVIQEEQKSTDPMTGQEVVTPAQTQIDRDAPYLTVLHPFNCFPDPMHDDERTMEWFWVREELSKTELADRAISDGYEPEAVQELIESQNTMDADIDGMSNSRFDVVQTAGVAEPQFEELESQYKPVHIYHRYSRKAWVTCSPRGDILRAIPNPSPDGDLPVIGLRPDPDIQGILGVPPVEAAASLQKFIDRTVSQMQSYTNKVVDPLLYKKMTSPVAMTKIKNAPGEQLLVLDIDDVGPVMKDPGTYPITVEHLNMYKYWSDQGLNVSDFQKGLGAQGAPDTAFGISKFTAQADSRFAIEFALTVQFFRRLFRKVGYYNQSYLDKPQWVRRMGMGGVKGPARLVNKTLLQGEFRYNLDTSASRTDPAAYSSSVVQFAQTWGPMLGTGVYHLARDHGEAIGLKNLDRIVPPAPEPMDPETENMLLQVGLLPHPTQFDDVQGHLTSHIQKKAMMTAMGLDTTMMDQHINETLVLAQQMAQGGQGGGGGGEEEEGGSDAKKSARKQQKEGGQGKTGSPGPPAPPGRSQGNAMEGGY